MKVLIKKNAYLKPFSMGHGSQFSGAAYDSTGNLINLSCRSNKNVAYKHINSDIGEMEKNNHPIKVRLFFNIL